MVQTKTLQEWWCAEYRKRRYLEHATRAELKQRIYDLLGSMRDFSAEGKMVFRSPLEDDWAQLFTHVLEELKLRNEPLTDEILSCDRPDGSRYQSVRRAAELWQPGNHPEGTYLLKFGKLKYLRPLLNVGALRVSPASSYADQSHNASIRDEELEFTAELYGARVRHPPNGDQSCPKSQWIEMPVIGNVKTTWEADSDYYVACFSASYEYRLYDDFEADGCLIITDVVRFARSVKSRMAEVLPGWNFSLDNVDYRDPCRRNAELSIYFTKHFRYAYQKEFRFVWTPRVKHDHLKPVHLELGPLTDYCELLCL